jgi:O-antigen/teichoic acid export membrane protein
MFSHIKRLLQHTIIYGLGNFISKGIMFLLVPLLTNTISPAEYGKLSIAQMFIGLAEVFFMLGMRQAILRYAVKEEYTRSRVFSAGVAWIFLASTFFFALLCATGGPVNRLLTLYSDSIYRNMLIILVLDAFCNAPFAELQSQQRSGYYMLLRLSHVIVYFGLSLYLILALKRTDVNAILEANIAASAFQLLCSLPVYLKLYRPQMDWPLMKRMVQFGLPYVPNLIFVIIIDLIDRVLVSRWLSIEAAGYYSAAYKFANLMYILVTAFQTAWQPFFLSHLRSEQGHRLFSRVLTYYTLSAALLFIVMGLFYREIASLRLMGFSLIGPQYVQGLSVVPVLLLAYVFCGVYMNFLVGIYAKEKTVYIPLITFAGAALNVGVNYWAIPRFGIMGAALATLLSYAVMALLLYPVSMRLQRIHYEWDRIAKIVLAVLIVYLPGFFIGAFLPKMICATLFLPALYAMRFFNAEELGRVRGLVRR